VTKEEFIREYCDRSGITWEWLSQTTVVLPCTCDSDICQGWAMILNDPDTIRTHLFFYGPDEGRPESPCA
jgi:hypothetical protein